MRAIERPVDPRPAERASPEDEADCAADPGPGSHPFIPCRVEQVVQELAALSPEAERPRFWKLAHLLENLHHHRAGVQGRLLGALYAPFDPDAETVAPEPAAAESLQRFEARLDELLRAANFEPVPRETLETPGEREVLNRLKIDPDFDAVERLSVWVRGRGTKALRIRPVRRMFRLHEVEVPTHRRVVVAVRTRHDPHLTLKLFKDVPVRDLELLLPTVRVRMRLFDKLKLSGSGGAAAISAWKLLRLAYVYTPGLAKLLALPFQVLLLPLFLLVGGIYGGKTVLDYAKIRASYVTALAEHLYAITLASNRSVIALLAEMAAEEETKELLLAYALLGREPRPGIGPAALKERVEAFVQERWRARIAFDADGALRELDELALGWRGEGDARSVLPVDAALRNVDKAWDELYSPS